ncbi:MAG: T9SS type A sorting domain-containing protein [Polaribacter sp.]|uniref:T9SS type A sorting domain-containing protein n=1 Tax=Polaribacter sp. TaxID=1920175 RepID=UPI0038517D4A
MKKITFQRKQKVVKRVLLLLIIAFVSNLNSQTTLLTVGAGGAVKINSGGTLNVSGLELSPNSNYTITETQVSKEMTAVSLDGTQAMEKVYSLDTDLENFSGTITYNYVDSEMNNLSHDASMYVYGSTSSAWSEYLDTDSADYTVTSTFTSPNQVGKVTVGALNSLSIEDAMAMGIRIYPNPFSSVINVDYSEDLQLTLFNVLGQQVLSASSKTINISKLDHGTYILRTKDSNNNINNFKIIKQ